MKKIVFFSLLLTLIACSNQKENRDTIITGRIKDSSGTVATLNLADTSLVDTIINGNFSFKIKNLDKEYVSLTVADNIRLFIKNGDSIHLDITLLGNINLSGKGYEESLFIQKKKATAEELGIADPRMIDEATFSSDIVFFTAKIDSIRKVLTNFLAEYKDYSSLDISFVEKEKKLCQYYWMQQKFGYPEFHKMLTNNEVQLPQDYYNFIDKIDFNDSMLLPFEEYKSCLKGLLELKTKDIAQKDLSLRLNTKYALCKELTNSTRVAETICFQLLRSHIVFNGIDGIDTSFYDFLQLAKKNEYKKELNRQYKAWEQLKRGNQAPEFELVDISGKMVKLSDFLGKIVYIDCWSTKCGRCISEMPRMKALVDEMESNKEIIFITISSDSDKDKWKERLEKFNIKSINLCTGENYGKFNIDYNAKAMPRYILIDKEGKLIDVIAEKPSEIKEKLEKLSKT